MCPEYMNYPEVQVLCVLCSSEFAFLEKLLIVESH